MSPAGSAPSGTSRALGTLVRVGGEGQPQSAATRCKKQNWAFCSYYLTKSHISPKAGCSWQLVSLSGKEQKSLGYIPVPWESIPSRGISIPAAGTEG